jgi:hypothetical protein
MVLRHRSARPVTKRGLDQGHHHPHERPLGPVPRSPCGVTRGTPAKAQIRTHCFRSHPCRSLRGPCAPTLRMSASSPGRPLIWAARSAATSSPKVAVLSESSVLPQSITSRLPPPSTSLTCRWRTSPAQVSVQAHHRRKRSLVACSRPFHRLCPQLARPPGHQPSPPRDRAPGHGQWRLRPRGRPLSRRPDRAPAGLGERAPRPLSTG